MHTEAINHDPAITFFQTGCQLAGRPSIGAWLAYGLGSENQDLPAFVVMISQGTRQSERSAALRPAVGQRLSADAISGREVPLGRRSGAVPVESRRASTTATRRRCSTTWRKLNQMQPGGIRRSGDRDAHRAVRDGVPDADVGAGADRSLEGAASTSSSCTGPTRASPGTFAANCLLARRLAERGVRFVQLFHRGWDQHAKLPKQIAGQCRDTDQPSAALVQDLKQRGLLDDTLVVWGGEFGRTVYCQGKLTADDYGRDHHPRCFTIWMAGGGVKPGITLRRDRRLLLQHRAGPGPRPRPARDDPALPGHRPHAADLQVPGPPLPADRCARRSGEESSGVGERLRPLPRKSG